jgi:endonuclease-8
VPEGDTIFRTARALGRALIDKAVTSFRSTYPLLTSFDDDTPIAGQTVEKVDSRGKWLLIHFSGGGTLATHMLMSGSWHIYRHDERWQQPRANMRIVLENDDYIAVGFRVPVAKMLSETELERALTIPPPAIDVLSDDFDAAEVARRMLQHGGEEIGDLLLRQEVIAGVGNVFKSEICFVTAMSPFSKVAAFNAENVAALIATARRLLKRMFTSVN